jgi:hypothetical protein
MHKENQNSLKRLLISILIAIIFIILLSFFLRFLEEKIKREINTSIKIAGAAVLKYQAKIIDLKPKKNLKLKANSVAKLKIWYQNKGKTWVNHGKEVIKLNADETAKKFFHQNWLSKSTPTKLYFPKIEIGESIWFEIPIKVPKTNGVYELKFFLTAGSDIVLNSEAVFEITVFNGEEPSKEIFKKEIFKINKEQKNNFPVVLKSNNLKIESGSEILIPKIADEIKIEFDFALKKFFINSKEGKRLVMTDQPFKVVSINRNEKSKIFYENEYEFCEDLIFDYQIENQTVLVKSIGSLNCQPKILNQYFWQIIPKEINIIEDIKYEEPTIRVGLFYQLEDKKDKLPIKIRTLDKKSYRVETKSKKLLVRATQGELLEVDFDFKLNRYFLNENNHRLVMTDEPLVFIPDDEQTIFEVASWENGPFWGLNVNDNDFRGKLEVRYNPNTKKLWLINELLMEDYLAGNMEIWDSWPYEFLKAQMIAARTYAFFRYLNPKYTNTPDDEPLFTVRATQADQVYRGYQAELRNPNTVKAVKETRGIIATYNDQPILAYYFAQSDGRTRAAHEVGMTKEPVPYLISRPDPPGENQILKGHGVGMPQKSGKIIAEQGANFSQILKYYYPGIQLKKVYL